MSYKYLCLQFITPTVRAYFVVFLAKYFGDFYDSLAKINVWDLPAVVMGYWGCTGGWGRIFTTRLTIMGSPFQAFSIEILEWGRTFSGL